VEQPATLIVFGLAILLGAMSPGPSFFVVAQTAMARSRNHGMLTALGMGIGGGLLALAACLGLHVMLTAIPSLYRALQIAGGAYLLFVAWKIWRSAPQPLVMSGLNEVAAASGWRDLLRGLGTQLSNPKTALVYASVFAAALPEAPPLSSSMVLVAMIAFIEFGWYALVATAFSSAQARRAYAGAKTWIDRLAAGVLGALGVRLLVEARGP
jgi:threonine/homoserine/homoserine lactone efflux protein